MVDSASARFCWIVDIHRLLHVGGISGKKLFLWQLHLAVLFAGTSRGFTAQLVWTETGMVACVASVLAGASYPLGSGRFPAHLLLLPWRVLQSLLG